MCPCMEFDGKQTHSSGRALFMPLWNSHQLNLQQITMNLSCELGIKGYKLLEGAFLRVQVISYFPKCCKLLGINLVQARL